MAEQKIKPVEVNGFTELVEEVAAGKASSAALAQTVNPVFTASTMVTALSSDLTVLSLSGIEKGNPQIWIFTGNYNVNLTLIPDLFSHPGTLTKITKGGITKQKIKIHNESTDDTPIYSIEDAYKDAIVATNLLFEEIFTGTTITGTVTEPDTPNPDWSQDDALLAESSGTGTGGTTPLSNYVQFPATIPNTGKLSLQVTFPSDTFSTSPHDDSIVFQLRVDSANYLLIKLRSNNGIQAFCRIAGNPDYSYNSGQNGVGMHVKFQLDQEANTVEAFWCPIGGGDNNWTSLLTAATMNAFPSAPNLIADFVNTGNAYISKVTRLAVSNKFTTDELLS